MVQGILTSISSEVGILDTGNMDQVITTNGTKFLGALLAPVCVRFNGNSGEAAVAATVLAAVKVVLTEWQDSIQSVLSVQKIQVIVLMILVMDILIH